MLMDHFRVFLSSQLYGEIFIMYMLATVLLFAIMVFIIAVITDYSFQMELAPFKFWLDIKPTSRKHNHRSET